MAAEALADIKGYAAAGRIRVTMHAEQRMAQRGVQFADVLAAIRSAVTCRQSKDASNRWIVEGRDRDGDDLAVCCAIEQGVVVITVF